MEVGIAANRQESVGAEAPPTTALPRRGACL
ncbi:DUF6053 domain-containing protein [Lysobacter enzymogenes]